jgi:hypothetical protein
MGLESACVKCNYKGLEDFQDRFFMIMETSVINPRMVHAGVREINVILLHTAN